LQSVTLPPLAGSRPAAALLLAALPANLTGQHVAVLGRQLLSGSPSFADELIRQLTVERNAAQVEVIGAEPTFEEYVREAARIHAVADRVSTRRRAAVPAPAGVTQQRQ
jgi:hypothetical protein